MRHTRPQPYDDSMNVGQRTVARIRAEIAQREMGRAARVAFSTGYENPAVRAAARKAFSEFRAQYETAKEVLQWETLR